MLSFIEIFLHSSTLSILINISSSLLYTFGNFLSFPQLGSIYTEMFLSLNVPSKKRFVFEFVETTTLLRKIWNVQFRIVGNSDFQILFLFLPRVPRFMQNSTGDNGSGGGSDSL